eukprot:651994-Pyramimonas_sp.AAC.2
MSCDRTATGLRLYCACKCCGCSSWPTASAQLVRYDCTVTVPRLCRDCASTVPRLCRACRRCRRCRSWACILYAMT